MATLRLFASIREAAGERAIEIDAPTVKEAVDIAVERFGEHFGALVPTCRIWINGEPGDMTTEVGESDEIALLPPVSGGAVALPASG